MQSRLAGNTLFHNPSLFILWRSPKPACAPWCPPCSAHS